MTNCLFDWWHWLFSTNNIWPAYIICNCMILISELSLYNMAGYHRAAPINGQKESCESSRDSGHSLISTFCNMDSIEIFQIIAPRN